MAAILLLLVTLGCSSLERSLLFYPTHQPPSGRLAPWTLDGEIIGYARVVASYRACLAHKRPTYSVSTVQDGDGKNVCYERLLLPFGKSGTVEQIVGSYKAISIDATFGYLGGAATTLALPDYSALAGWDNNWAPAASSTGDWTVSGTSSFPGSACTENASFKTAALSGTF